MKRLLPLFLFLLSPSLLAWEVGVSKVEVTPSLKRTVWLAGFRPNRKAVTIHDPLWARSLAFVQGKQVFLLCVVDCIGLLHPDLWEVRTKASLLLGVPVTSIVIASTHTHSGPDTIGLWGPRFTTSGRDEVYLKELKKRILKSLAEAYLRRKPAKLFYARERESSVLKDTRPPFVTEPTLHVLQAMDPKGRTIATWIQYAMHPEVLTGRSQAVSSDYPHYLREWIEAKLGGVCVFSVGPIGGMQTPRKKGQGFQEAKRIGVILAKKAFQALQKKKRLSPYLKVKAIRVWFPITNVRFLLGTRLGLFGALKVPGCLLFQSLEADIHAIQMGKLVILTCPGELFPEVKQKLSLSSPFFILGLANHEIGYILPKHSWTPFGYEETMSLSPEVAPILLRAWKILLKKENCP